MLRKVRTVLAIVSIVILSLLFLDFTGLMHSWFGWMAKVQFIPALLSINIGVIIFLIVITLVFGRIYCSVICPLGIFQDLISWFSARRKKHKYTYSKELSYLRYGVFALFILAIIFSLASVVALLDPYAAFGRIMYNMFAPVYQLGNNILSSISSRLENYYFYDVEIWLKSMSAFVVSVITLILIVYLSWKYGRTYCNTICPIGTFLGLLSRYSLFKPIIDKNTCNGCKACSRNCKASCIDTTNHSIDYSRCVVCMDCLDECSQDAISYTFRKPLTTKGEVELKPIALNDNFKTTRRNFLATAGILAVTGMVKSQQIVGEGGLAEIIDKEEPKRITPVLPPGSIDKDNFNTSCTACGLCITACTNNVLRPSSSLPSFMQPQMSFERGFCRPECTACGDVCPTTAILPLSVEMKAKTQIGYAVYLKDLCVVKVDDVDCDACARNCPTKAIEMISSNPENPETRKIPKINTDLCNGCGACEHLCPARPLSAIIIEGVENHKPITLNKEIA